MIDLLRNPAFWAGVGVILAALGVELPEKAGETILEWLSVISGVIAIIFAIRDERSDE